MIKRYTRPEMAAVWAPDQKFSYWLKVELAVLDAKRRFGLVGDDDYVAICTHAGFTVDRITELDTGPNGFNHDLIAFVETVKEHLREAGVSEETVGLFHIGVTSYDIEDNAFVLQLQAACEPIMQMLLEAREVIYARALEHKMTPIVAKTHGQAAELTSLGKRLLDYVDLLDQHIERLRERIEETRVGRLAGAVGTYGHLGPEFERQVCEALELEPVRVSTQIINRSRFANLFNALALLASDIGQIAEGMWLMCSFPRLEAREPFGRTQRGSSAMPHKKNPITLERLRGLAITLRGYQAMIMEAIATRDERAIDQSCVERIAWPDGTILVYYMLHLLKGVMQGAEFYPEQMQANINRTLGVLGTGFVKDALLERGINAIDYDGEQVDAYTYAQKIAFEAWKRQVHMMTVLHERGAFGVTVLFPGAEGVLQDCFRSDRFLVHIEEIFERFDHLEIDQTN